MREVYVLMRGVGEYSDRDESPVLATLDRAEAETCLARAQAYTWPDVAEIWESDGCCVPWWETSDALETVRTYGAPRYWLVTVRLMGGEP